MVARQYRVEETPVAKVGLARAIEALRPRGRGAGRSGCAACEGGRSAEAREPRSEQPCSGQFEHVAPIGHFSLLAKERPGPRKRRPGLTGTNRSVSAIEARTEQEGAAVVVIPVKIGRASCRERVCQYV